jgi:hypothetical protein
MKKRTLITLLAGIAIGAVAVSAPALSSSSGTVDVRPGSYVHWIGLDWACSGGGRDPDHNDPGPYIYCSRYSTKDSRAVSVSRFHIAVTDKTGGYTVYKVARTP